MRTKELKAFTVRNKKFVLGCLEQPRQNKNLLYWHVKPNEPIREGFFAFVLFEYPFS
jgi:hypothetical protein